ncbi:MAG: prefoldin subunit beta [Nanobdellota archaeon]
MDKQEQDKAAQLSQLEQRAHSFLTQRQELQSQLMEIESALKELEGAKESYKIVGNIMVSRSGEGLKEELREKKEKLEVRVKSIQKQEEKIKEKASALQKEVMGNKSDENVEA